MGEGHIDIQMCLSGKDLIGYKPISECKKQKQAYSSKKDCELFNDKIDMWLKLSENTFAIFSPADAHAPLAGRNTLKKIVIKLRER